MTERMDATALALDAYEQHLFGDLANGHRNDRAEAEGLLHSLVIDLINYGQGNHLDVVDLLDALVQARIDRGGALVNPRYSFRLDTEVQFRDHSTEPYRGFITELKSPGPGQDTECVLRVPGIIDPQHTGTSELEPATRMVPLSTRICGTVFSAAAAENTIIEIISALAEDRYASSSTRVVLADLAELSTALATWSGTTPERVLHHLHHLANGRSSAAQRAATAFPHDIAANLAGEQPIIPPSSRPASPSPGPSPHQL